MPTPPTLVFEAENGTSLDLNGAAYQYLEFPSGWSAPPVEVSIIGRTQTSGVSIPYAAVDEREFELRLLVRGDTAAESQGRLNALITATLITQGTDEPRFGVLTFDGYGAGSDPIAIRCAAKSVSQQRAGLNYIVSLIFTSESGIWYSPTRVELPPVTVSVADTGPVLGSGPTFPGDPLPWDFGVGLPSVRLTFNYAGSAITDSLEVRITGPAEKPSISRDDTTIRFVENVPVDTTLLVRMATGGKHQLLGGGDAVLADWNASADSFRISLAPGGNVLTYTQRNQIEGGYNAVSFSYRNEFLSLGV